MSILDKAKAMNVRRARTVRQLLLWRMSHHRRSLLAQERVEDCNSSFTESLLTDKQYGGSWYRPHSEKVPRGFVPVYVGLEERRFVIPMVYLSMPDFRRLMESTAEEFGFDQEGRLKIACDEDDFEEILFKCSICHRAATKTKRK